MFSLGAHYKTGVYLSVGERAAFLMRAAGGKVPQGKASFQKWKELSEET